MRAEGVVQESPEWVVMRIGCATASRIADVMAKLTKASKNGKAGDAAAPRINYRIEIATETLTGRAVDHYVSKPMEWGIETQNMAAVAYEMAKGVSVDPGGFWLHDKIAKFGASPDYLVGKDGLLEIKCPNSTTHVGYILADAIPEEYRPQMLAEMACTGRQWVDFVSYDPRMPEKHKLFVKRLERDEKAILEMEQEVEKFLGEVQDVILQLENGLVPKLVQSLEAVQVSHQ